MKRKINIYNCATLACYTLSKYEMSVSDIDLLINCLFYYRSIHTQMSNLVTNWLLKEDLSRQSLSLVSMPRISSELDEMSSLKGVRYTEDFFSKTGTLSALALHGQLTSF